jgi:hypothetical protein
VTAQNRRPSASPTLWIRCTTGLQGWISSHPASTTAVGLPAIDCAGVLASAEFLDAEEQGLGITAGCSKAVHTCDTAYADHADEDCPAQTGAQPAGQASRLQTGGPTHTTSWTRGTYREGSDAERQACDRHKRRSGSRPNRRRCLSKSLLPRAGSDVPQSPSGSGA